MGRPGHPGEFRREVTYVVLLVPLALLTRLPDVVPG